MGCGLDIASPERRSDATTTPKREGRALKTLATIGLVVLVAVAAVVPASADTTPYRVRLFGCATGNTQASFVPHDTPLFVDAGWISGTTGLVQSFLQNVGESASLTDVRVDGTTVLHNAYGPIEQVDPTLLERGWRSVLRYDLQPLALGQRATLTFSFTLGHPQADLGLPTPGDDQVALQYHTLVPAGQQTFVCTITAV